MATRPPTRPPPFPTDHPWADPEKTLNINAMSGMSGDPDDFDLNDQLTDEETSAIAALLRQGLPETREGEDIIGASSVRGPSEPIVLRYDLVAGSSHRNDDLPGLQLLHERFATELSNEFRRAVGSEGQIFPERVSHAKFAEFYARMTLPTAIVIANLHGIGCSVVIAMEPVLALHFVDLLMGGEGGEVVIRNDLASRGFTQAEKGVLRHVLAIFSRALKTAWVDIVDVELELSRVATDPRHAAVYEPSEAMVELAVGVEWGDVSGHVKMTIPTSFLGQFEDALSRTATPNHLKAELGNVEQMSRNLGEVEVHLSVILGMAEMSLERLLTLEVGDVVRLDTDPAQALVVCVEDVPKLSGHPTLLHGNIAIEVADMTVSNRHNHGRGGPARFDEGPTQKGGPDARR